MIAAVVDDLLFLSKIQQTALHVRVSVKCYRPADLVTAVIEDIPNAVILDLNHGSGQALKTLGALKSEAKTKNVPVIGFASHVQAPLIAAARAAGCDLVLARSAFVDQLPKLLQRYS